MCIYDVTFLLSMAHDLCICLYLAVDCGTPPDLPHGNVTFPDTIYRSIATYVCDKGYRLVGSSSRTCLPSSLWSTDTILCVGEYIGFNQVSLDQDLFFFFFFFYFTTKMNCAMGRVS